MGPLGAAIPKAPEPTQGQGHEVAGSRDCQAAGKFPQRQPGRALGAGPAGGGPQERAPAGSAPPPAPRCSGSRAPPATRPAQPGQSPAQPPQLLPPDRHRAEAGRGGAGAHLLDQSTPLLPPRQAGLGRADPIPGSRSLSPLWLRVWAGPHAPSLPPPIQVQRAAVSASPPRPSVRTPGFQS